MVVFSKFKILIKIIKFEMRTVSSLLIVVNAIDMIHMSALSINNNSHDINRGSFRYVLLAHEIVI